MSILRFLKLEQEKPAVSTGETETVRKITAALDEMDPDRAKYIAAFAFILSRVARADLTITPEETRAMERIVAERGNMPEDQAIIVVQIAKSQNILFGSTENYLVTREFNKMATQGQKLELLECLFAVSAADDSVSTLEDNEVRQIADELRLEHREFIAARSNFREYLAFLKKNPQP